MTQRDELARARDTVARQAEEIDCLRRLVHELAARADQAPQTDPAAAPERAAEPIDGPVAPGALEAPSGEPAWSWVTAFLPGILPAVSPIGPLDDLTPDWAWGGSSGRGVRVAVIDSGVRASHPAIGGRVSGYVAITAGPDGLGVDTAPHDDAHGHGTACAGLIRAFAPDCELYSIKVLDAQLAGSGEALVAGLRWAIDHGMQVCNLSLGTTRAALREPLQRLADEAYFRNVLLVTAANNLAVESFPAAFASVIAVAAVRTDDPYRFCYNPQPPVEFGARGYDVRVAGPKRRWITASANSFAAPHLSGIVAQLLGKHPGLTPFQVKTVLRALAANVARPDQP